jgi:hypothetical protein
MPSYLGDVSVKYFFWRGGYGRISGWIRVFKLAADIRETTPGKGARYSSSNNVELTQGGHHDTDREEDNRDGRSCVV